MKVTIAHAIAAITAAILLVSYVIAESETNYRDAVNAAAKSICTDEAIERAMYGYGFDISAADTTEPSMITKIDAYFKN
jgi:hypothetical protein